MARWCSCLLSYNRMEPFPGADPGGTPIPRASGRRSEGHRSGSWTRTSVRLLQRQAGMPSTHPGTNWSPRQVPPLASRPYKGRPLAGAGGKYARRDSNPQSHGPRPCPSTCLRTSAREPPPGADPGHPPYEGGAAAVRGGKATLPGFEPGTSWFRAKRCCRFELEGME